MNLADLTAKVRARAVADTGSGGLFNVASPLVTAFNAWRVEPEASMPYGWFEIVSAVQDDTIPVDEYVATVRMHLTCDVNAGFSNPDAILDRYFALFHRWTPTLTGGWTAGTMERRSFGMVAEDNEYHFWDDYQIRISKAVS